MCTIGYLLFGQGTADAAIRTPKKPVVDEYHGVKVVDDFQWLENADDPAVRRWSDAQNKHTRATLDKLLVRPWIEDRLRRLFSGSSASYFALSSRRGQLFLLKQSTPGHQPMLVTLNSITNLSSSV
jgi:prolyl oligopeptidase